MLNDLLVLWCDHKIIGTIIGLFAIAFLCQIYMLPFRIIRHLNSKKYYMSCMSVQAGLLVDLIHMKIIQNKAMAYSTSLEEYEEMVEEEYKKYSKKKSNK